MNPDAIHLSQQMANPYQTPQSSPPTRQVRTPRVLIVIGALSSSLLGGLIVFNRSVDGGLRLVLVSAFMFFVAGGIYSLVPAWFLKKRLMTDAETPKMFWPGLVLVAVFCVPFAVAITLIFVAMIAPLIGNLFGALRHFDAAVDSNALNQSVHCVWIGQFVGRSGPRLYPTTVFTN